MLVDFLVKLYIISFELYSEFFFRLCKASQVFMLKFPKETKEMYELYPLKQLVPNIFINNIVYFQK